MGVWAELANDITHDPWSLLFFIFVVLFVLLAIIAGFIRLISSKYPRKNKKRRKKLQRVSEGILTGIGIFLTIIFGGRYTL